MSTITEKKKDGKVVAFKFQLCIGRDDQGNHERIQLKTGVAPLTLRHSA